MSGKILGAALVAVTALTACGNGGGDAGGTSGLGALKAAVAQARAGLPGGGKAAAPAPARDPAAMAAEALRVNPGPLILAGVENMGTTQVLAMVGENAGSRTYMTKGEQSLILRGGLLTGTRGLGNDLASAEIGTEPLIRAARAGQAKRVLRIWTGDGKETPLSMTCDVAPAGSAGGGRQVVETCRAGRLAIENRYLVSGGAISVSRQWAGPKLGYITLQTIRP